MFDSTDSALFSRIIRNDKHGLQHYLPEHYKLEYNLRPRQHSKQLLSKTTELNNRDYIVTLCECCVKMHIDVMFKQHAQITCIQ